MNPAIDQSLRQHAERLSCGEAGIKPAPEATVVLSMDEAVRRLRQTPASSVVAEVGGLRVEVRLAPTPSAADLFRALGPWEGEDPDALAAALRQARAEGGSRQDCRP